MRVEVAPDQEVIALVYHAAKPYLADITLILGHGAGADQTSGFLTKFATELAARGVNTITFNFLYTEQGRCVPDTNNKLEACFRAVVETTREKKNRPWHAGDWRQVDGWTNRFADCCSRRRC